MVEKLITSPRNVVDFARYQADRNAAGRAQAMLPFVAALGGIITPALIYTLINYGTPEMRGLAIPTATDIA
ncbi:MAG: Na+/H+ antiporter NhaA, partial [Pseudomonadota bacterium]